MKDILFPALLGAGTGILATLLVWKIVSIQIDNELGVSLTAGEAQLRATLDGELETRIPPLVQRALQDTLRQYNITPQTGAQIRRIIAAASALT